MIIDVIINKTFCYKTCNPKLCTILTLDIQDIFIKIYCVKRYYCIETGEQFTVSIYTTVPFVC